MPYGGNIHGAVGADIVQADVDAIVQGVAGSPGRTLADLHAPLAGVLECLLGNQSGAITGIGGQLGDGLFDEWGSPLLQVLGENLHGYLFSPASAMPWMEMLNLNLDYYLNDSMGGYQPWLQTIHNTMGYLFESYLYDVMAGSPWLGTINNTVSSGLMNYTGEPFLGLITGNIAFYLNDSVNSRPWMETLDTRLAALLAILDDVYDSTQHALRTV